MYEMKARRRMETAKQAIAETPEAPMPFRSEIQQSFGRHSIAHLRAHTGGSARERTHELDGDALTFGDRLVFGAQPSLHLAAHEAAHGYLRGLGVAPHMAGVAGDRHEQLADTVADHVVQGRSAEPLLDRVGHAGPIAPPAVQMGIDDKHRKRREAQKKKKAVRSRRDPLGIKAARGTAFERLQRAHQRAQARRASGDTSSRHAGVQVMNTALRNWQSGNGTQAQVASGAGPFQLSTGRAAQPKITMRQGDYGGASFGTSAPPYAAAVTSVSGAPNGPALVQSAFESGAADTSALTNRQRLAVSALSSIPHTAEEDRVGGMGKGFRALVRQGVADPEKFKNIPQSYPMVESAQHGRDVLSGDAEMHPDFVSALEDDAYYSESSDDESHESAKEKLKPKGRRPPEDDDDDDGGPSHGYNLRSTALVS